MVLAIIIFLLFPEVTLEWRGKTRKYTLLVQGFLSALSDTFNGKEALLVHYKSEEINEED